MSTWRVPGRIEVLGKHTDYAGGRVLVGAVERAVTVSGDTAGSTTHIEVRTSLDPTPVQLRAGEAPELPAGHWGLYVQTVIDRLTSNFGPLAPASLTVSSDLPPASGMSSSSALLTGVALVLADLNGLPERSEWREAIHDRLDLAGYMASIENGKSFKSLSGRPGVGTSGGSLDHTGMLTSEAGMLSHVEFDPPTIVERVPMIPGLTFVVAVSGVLAEKTGSARELYNRGPQTLGEILAAWNRESGRADGSLHAVVRHLSGEGAPVKVGDARLEPLRKVAAEGYPRTRLEQFLVESCVLVPAAARAFADADVPALGEIVAESQAYAETHLLNQVPETVDLVNAARALGAPAASAFGAGFGGSVWALVPTGDADAFAEQWMAEYKARFPALDGASALVTGAGGAATRLE